MDEAAFIKAYDDGLADCLARYPERTAWSTKMSTFVWRPGAGPSWTRFGRELTGLLESVMRTLSGPQGQRFGDLVNIPEYSRQYEAGYEFGRKAGADYALRRWRDEYVTVLVQVVRGLTTCVKEDPLFVVRLTEAAFRVYMLPPEGAPGVFRDKRYRQLSECLRSGLPPRSSEEEAPADPATDPQAESRQGARWMYETALATYEEEDLGILDTIDLVAANIIAGFKDELDELLGGIVQKNGYPVQQGFFAGWCISNWNVQTLRWIIETTAEFESPI